MTSCDQKFLYADIVRMRDSTGRENEGKYELMDPLRSRSSDYSLMDPEWRKQAIGGMEVNTVISSSPSFAARWRDVLDLSA